MTSPDKPKKSGFLTTFAQSVAPRPPEGDEAAKNKRPTTVVIALVAATLGGALFLFNAATMFQFPGSEGWDQLVKNTEIQSQAVADACTSTVGGVGSAVPSAEISAPLTVPIPALTMTGTVEPSQVAELCRTQPDSVLTQETLDSVANQYRIIGGAEVLIGLLAIVGAFLMRNGSVGMRRIVLGAVVLSLILSLMVSSSATVITLIGSLFLVAALVLCYVGRGGGWFLYRTAGRARH